MNNDIKYQNYSVLMSVYRKDNPKYFKEAIESILNQTIQTNDFILVCDGPLNEEIESVIKEMEEKMKDRLQIIRLKKNRGLGNALNIGLKHCKNELIARMDSDDISRPDRCENQLLIFQKYPDVSICSGIIEEFTISPQIIDSIRKPPENNEEIRRFAKKRCPYNHPCVMYKKSEVEKAGGYIGLYLMEDYYLWVRMILNNAKGYNIQTPILWMRGGNSMYKRRGGIKYIKSQLFLFNYMYKMKFISVMDYIESVISRFISGIMPAIMRRYFFKKFLRVNI